MKGDSFFAWIALLGATLAGCGGKSRTPVPVAAAADAVLWTAPAGGPSEFRIIRAGLAGAAFFGRTDGFYALSPDRRHLSLQSENDAVVRSVDGTERVLSDASVGTWSPDGARLALRKDGVPSIADGNGESPVPVRDAPEYADSIVWTYDGAIVWTYDGSRVAFGIDSSVVQALADGSTAVVTATGPPTPPGSDFSPSLRLRWAPNGESLAVVAFDGTVMFIDASGALNPSGVRVRDTFDWSVDGDWFAVLTSEFTCGVLSPTGAREDAFTGCYFGVWSPVDARLALNEYGGMNDGNVLTWSPGDAAPTTLAEHPAKPALSWSPDGSVVAYQIDPDAGGFVLLDARDGTELGRIAAPEFHWNPQGTRLFMLTAEHELVTADARAGAQRTIASDARAVTWLADGETLAVASSVEAFTLRADGTHRTVAWAIPSSVQAFGWVEPQSITP